MESNHDHKSEPDVSATTAPDLYGGGSPTDIERILITTGDSQSAE